MDEIQIIDGDSVGDDFYENLEAPKFVDLTAPDHQRPHNDDRYWFCLRVGCDQKHEEEMDSEAIYKNFVLRVMAARSPNVRLRKALYGKDPSSKLKCPLTVPTKPSKSRLALVSSISQKIVDGKAKGRPLFKQCETPKKKEKQSSVVVAKALTTPRNKKRASNLGILRSVRNPNQPAVAVPKNRVVAKALVFHSPKKTVRINMKKSTELSVRKLCAGMKNLEITNRKKDALGSNKPVPVDSSRKRFRGREVKSRVFDCLHPQNCKGEEAKSLKCVKKKSDDKELRLHHGPDLCDAPLGKCSTSGATLDDLQFHLDENKDELDTSRSERTRTEMHGDSNAHTPYQNGEINKACEGSDFEEKVESSPETRIRLNAIQAGENKNISGSDNKENEGDDKENASACNDKENEGDDTENKNISGSDDKENEGDDKENASGSNDNRKLNTNTSLIQKKKILCKNETTKVSQTVTKGMNKTCKGNSAASINCAEGVNYRKPKLTNPKPFRLRTDERQVLKEANLEKKQNHLDALRKTNTNIHQKNAVQKNEKSLDQTEYASNDSHEGGEKESVRRTKKIQPQRRGTSYPQTLKAAAQRKESTTPARETVSKPRKSLAAAPHELSQDRAAKSSQESLKRTKSLCMKQRTRSRGVEPSKKKMLTSTVPDRLGVIKESSPTISRIKANAKPMERRCASSAAKASTPSASRPSILGRKPVTIPE